MSKSGIDLGRPTPPPLPRPNRAAAALLFPAALLLGALLAGSVRSLTALLPGCLIREKTGLHCPGCGGTRAFRALVRGDFSEALWQNAFGTLLILGVALLALRTSWEAWFPRLKWPRARIGTRTTWALLALIFVFAVLRNLPWEPFVRLAPH